MPCIYVGEVRESDGMREGRGIEIGQDTIVEGWFVNNQPNGFCRYYVNELDDYYKGYVKDALSHGQGRRLYGNGDEYFGGFKLGNRDGYGIYKKAANGERTHCLWNQGMANGDLKTTQADGVVYEVKMVNNKPQGWITYTHPSGIKYKQDPKTGKIKYVN